MITKRDREFYDLAYRTAESSDCADKHGAVLVAGSRVLRLAVNVDNGHPVSEQHGKVTQHAEQRLINTDYWAMDRKVTVYSARFRKYDNRFPFSRPCEMCQELMRNHGVTRCVYHDGWKLQELSVD